MVNKKKDQLGMNPSTASNRLVKDLLWNFIITTGGNSCYQCGCEMSRDNFSIEHKTPWLDSEDPIGLYFDIDNISFSHLSCNAGAARPRLKKYSEEEAAERIRESKRKYWTAERRKEYYLKTGK